MLIICWNTESFILSDHLLDLIYKGYLKKVAPSKFSFQKVPKTSKSCTMFINFDQFKNRKQSINNKKNINYH